MGSWELVGATAYGCADNHNDPVEAGAVHSRYVEKLFTVLQKPYIGKVCVLPIDLRAPGHTSLRKGNH